MKKYTKLKLHNYQLNKHKERIKDLNNLNNTKQQKTYFDKLYIRIFLSSLLLLILLFSKNILKLNEVNIINKHINILPIADLFTNMYTFNSQDVKVDLSTYYEEIVYKDGINYIFNESFNGVVSASNGIVIKIKKSSDKYFVTIKDDAGIEYTYGGIVDLNVSLYNYVLTNDIIGSAKEENNKFAYSITINKNNEFYSITKLYE